MAEIDHLILPVNDIADSMSFYTSVLGFTDDGPDPPFTTVRVSPTFVILLAPWGTDGNVHLAFALAPFEFDVALARIGEQGVPFGDSYHDAANGRGPIDERGAMGMGQSIYLLDPNRHLIELRHYGDRPS